MNTKFLHLALLTLMACCQSVLGNLVLTFDSSGNPLLSGRQNPASSGCPSVSSRSNGSGTRKAASSAQTQPKLLRRRLLSLKTNYNERVPVTACEYPMTDGTVEYAFHLQGLADCDDSVEELAMWWEAHAVLPFAMDSVTVNREQIVYNDVASEKINFGSDELVVGQTYDAWVQYKFEADENVYEVAYSATVDGKRRSHSFCNGGFGYDISTIPK